MYDFLAGEDRYKRSLADGSHRQTWAEAGPFWSPRLLFRAGLGVVRGPRGAVGRVSENFTSSLPD